MVSMSSYSSMRRQLAERARSSNFILPFEILFIIFSYYAEYETPRFPLETLLLVCRFWTDAALKHRIIWSRFKIKIKTVLNSVWWENRISHRLRLSGPESPIFFQLKKSLGLDDFKFPISDFHRPIFAIAGVGGVLCARWKEIEIEHPFMGVCDDIMSCFSYPTPILSSIKLHSFHLSFTFVPPVNHRFLPSAPSLRTIVLSRCDGIPFPDVGYPTYIELYGCSSYALFTGCLTDLAVLGTASRLQHLSLAFRGPAQPKNLPPILSSLISLHLGTNLPNNINKVRLPLLRKLSLDYHPNNITTLLTCSEIPLNNLESLRFALPDDFLRPIERELTTPCRSLFKECQRLKSLSLDEDMFKQIVRQVRKGKVDAEIFFNKRFNIRISTKVTFQPLEKPDWYSGPTATWTEDEEFGINLVLEDEHQNFDSLRIELAESLDGSDGTGEDDEDEDEDDEEEEEDENENEDENWDEDWDEDEDEDDSFHPFNSSW